MKNVIQMKRAKLVEIAQDVKSSLALDICIDILNTVLVDSEATTESRLDGVEAKIHALRSVMFDRFQGADHLV